MAYTLGMNGKLYRNDGTYAVPDWVEVTNVTDVTLSLEASEADVTTRTNNGWRATVQALREATVEFEMVWDTADENFTAVQEAFMAGTTIEFAVLDGAIDDPGSQGFRATMSVLKFSRSEPLEEAMKASVTLKPAYSANAPAWVEVQASSSFA